MARLHPRIPELLGNEPGLLRSYKREGKGLRFTNDVNVPLSRTEPEATCGRFFRALETGDARALEQLVSVPFAFDGQELITDTEPLGKRLAELMRDTRGQLFPIEWLSTSERPEKHIKHDLDRELVEQHLEPGKAWAVLAMWGQHPLSNHRIVMFVRRGPEGGYKIAGFSNLINTVRAIQFDSTCRRFLEWARGAGGELPEGLVALPFVLEDRVITDRAELLKRLRKPTPSHVRRQIVSLGSALQLTADVPGFDSFAARLEDHLRQGSVWMVVYRDPQDRTRAAIRTAQALILRRTPAGAISIVGLRLYSPAKDDP